MNCKTAKVGIETAPKNSIISIFTPSSIVKFKRDDIDLISEWEDTSTINIYLKGGKKEFYIDAPSIQAIKIYDD